LNILVDTSVWSLSLRRKSGAAAPQSKLLQEYILSGERICLIGIILQEILQGIRNEIQFNKLKSYFEAFPIISLDRDAHVHAAVLSNTCRRSGIQISTVDSLIASAAILHGFYLLTADEDFRRIKRIVPLQLL